MKKEDFTKKKDSELAELLAEKREEVRTFRFNAAGSALRDVRAVRLAKKSIARILTERSARSRA